MSDIEALDDWLQPLINRLSISQKKQLTKKLALEMRRRSVKKIKASLFRGSLYGLDGLTK